MIDLMKYKKLYLIFSSVILIPGIISLILFGLNLAVDFTGGSVFKYNLGDLDDVDIAREEVENTIREKGIKINEVYSDKQVLEVRTNPVESTLNDEISLELLGKIPGIRQDSFETVGPSIGKETTINAFKALGLASLGIMLYITFVFRNIPKPYSSLRFGVSALVAMLHDAFLLLGIFSILGRIYNIEIDALFITATLTVIGFSIHDSIVVFDRIRENLKKLPPGWGFERVVNFSVVETLNRSFATSLTVLITLFSLYILGGETIKNFVLALLIGILSGTYSSIFTASPTLVFWEEHISRKKRR